MTSIVYDGRTVVADRFFQICFGDKLARSGDKIIGITGPPYRLQQAIDWFAAGGDLDLEEDEIIVIDAKTGIATVYTGEMNGFDVDAPVAIGTGFMYAVGAMEAGATAMEALMIAAKRDPSTKVDYGTTQFSTDIQP